MRLETMNYCVLPKLDGEERLINSIARENGNAFGNEILVAFVCGMRCSRCWHLPLSLALAAREARTIAEAIQLRATEREEKERRISSTLRHGGIEVMKFSHSPKPKAEARRRGRGGEEQLKQQRVKTN